MKRLLILSGKGGTGKTTLAVAFIKLSNAKAYADCDVDAPNLHLIMNPESSAQKTDYYGLPKAEIDQSICVGCGLCAHYCKFGAIYRNSVYRVFVNAFACEGCGVCEAVCPKKAITMKDCVAGELMLYTGDAVFSTARLKMGSGTTGKLVAEVKNQLNEQANNADFAVIDGSPGIGCPVIASMSGVDMALIVAEPTLSGISDMKRILKTASFFGVKTAVCVNKYDVNEANTLKIEAFCKNNGIDFAGKIPYDNAVMKAVNEGKCITEISCPAGEAVRKVFMNTMKIMLYGVLDNDNKNIG